MSLHATGAVLPEFFRLEEFVHPIIFRTFGSQSIRMVSAFQIEYATALRNLMGPIRINNWHAGGNLQNRGTRPRSVKPKGGAEFSQHYLANALDTDTPDYKPSEMVECIHDNFDLFFNLGLRALEDVNYTPTWLHGDCRLLWPDQIKQIRESKKFITVRP